MFEGKTVWIIGASEGLGRALASELDRQGARLILSARNAARLEAFSAALTSARSLPMDVTDMASVATAVEAVGEIDAVIYSAGFYEPMSARDWQPETALTMCDVNFMGAMRVLGLLVPRLVARDAGQIILIGSLAGITGLPGAIGYGPGKAAIMHLAECLQADLRGTRVKVSLVNPGYFTSRLTEKNDFRMPQIMSAEAAARRVLRAAAGARFASYFPAAFSLVFRIGRLLPRKLFLRFVTPRDAD